MKTRVVFLLKDFVVLSYDKWLKLSIKVLISPNRL